MFIQRITLTNFRCFEDAEFELGERVLIAAENGRGKSSILDALSLVLLGECRGVNGKGEGQRDQIRDGFEQATIEVAIEGFPTITRVLNRSTSARQNITPTQIQDRLGVSAGMIAAVLSGEQFFKMHHAESRAVLFKALDVRIDPKDVPDLEGVSAPMDLDEVDFQEKTAREARAAAKKALALHHVPDAPRVVNIDQAEVVKANEADVRQQLEDARARKETHVEARARASGVLAEVGRQIDSAKRHPNVDALRGRRDTFREQLEEAEERLKAAITELAAFEDDAREKPSDLQAEQARIQGLIDRVGEHKPSGGCVLDAAIPCLTKAEAFKGQVEKLRADVKRLAERIKKAEKAERRRGVLEQSKDGADQNVTYNRAMLTEVESKLQAAEAAAASLGGLEATRAEQLRIDNAAGDAIAAIEPEIERLSRLLEAVRAYRQGTSGREAAIAKRKQLEDEVARCERLCEALGPGGLRATALAKSLGEFETAVNAALEGTEFTVTFQAEPWQVFVNDRRFVQLSDGQKILVGLAVQNALATISGLEFIAIDGAESVVGQNREALTEVVMTTPVAQVVVAMAKPDAEEDPDLDGLQVLRLGRTRETSSGYVVGVSR